MMRDRVRTDDVERSKEVGYHAETATTRLRPTSININRTEVVLP